MTMPTRRDMLKVLTTPSATMHILDVGDPWDRHVLRFLRDEAPAVATVAMVHQRLWAAQLEAFDKFDKLNDAEDECEDEDDDDHELRLTERKIRSFNPAGQTPKASLRMERVGERLLERLLHGVVPDHFHDDNPWGMANDGPHSYLGILAARALSLIEEVMAFRVQGWHRLNDERGLCIDVHGFQEDTLQDAIEWIGKTVWNAMPPAQQDALAAAGYEVYGDPDPEY